MVKNIPKLILAAIIVGIGWMASRWFTQPALIAPLPYKIEVKYGTEVDMAEAAHVLIVGDKLGYSLDRYSKKLTDRLSVKLKEPLRIYNWAKKNEGLNRTLHKIKSLKKFPPFILYLGSSEEFFEERFYIKDHKKILKNVKKFKEENIASLLYTFPQASRFIYSPVKFFILKDDPLYDPGDFTSNVQQIKMEVIFNLFDVELEEMISLIKEKGSYLVLSTAPVNLIKNPTYVCANTSTNSIESYQRVMQKRLDKGEHKTSLREIKKLSETTIGNAASFHLLGQAALGSGKIEMARDAFTKASAFDCGNKSSHPVFNSIIKKKVSYQGVKLIDFDNIVNRHLGSNELFLDDHYPQSIYYDHYIDEIYDIIKMKFQL